MIKMFDKYDPLNDTSPYSGKTSVSNEIFIRPVPKVDKDGNQLKPVQRYYVFRFINFQTDERTTPFIVRYEHVFFKKDASGKVIETKKICCPTTNWAQRKISEKIDSDYCPICKMSRDKNADAWKSFKQTHTYDSVSLQIAKDTKKHIAFYIPVYVVSDPTYEKNNGRIKILKISGVAGEESGKDAIATFNRIRSVIAEANQKNLIVFNGEEGANIAFLCEKQRKFKVDKNGNPKIDSKTGEQQTYIGNVITDVRLLSNKLHSYPNINEESIKSINFDNTYGMVATKDQLNAFMNENYLDTGASDSDFEDVDDSDFTAAEDKNVSSGASSTVESDENDFDSLESPLDKKQNNSSEEDEFCVDDIEIDSDESPSEAISRITKGKVNVSNNNGSISMKNKVELPPDAESLRNSTTDFSDDDLPF